MAIIKRGLKLGTALGVTYLTVEQRLWSQLSDKEIKEKLSAFHNYRRKTVTLVTEKTGLETAYIRQWISTKESLNVNSINAKNLWNRSVKTGFRVVSDLNLKDVTTRLQKLINNSK